jgi:nucleoside-diphosphate-sugar epimerase
MHVLISAHEAGSQRVVYASSSSVYGDIGEAINDEKLPANPVSPYAVSKLAGELYCRVWTHLRGLSTVSLRYFNVFGPGQPAESKYAAVFPAFISALIHGHRPEVHWDGEQSRDFTYIDDVVRANILAARAGPEADGAVMNIAGGKSRSVSEVLRAVSAAVGRWIEPTGAPKRSGDVRRTCANIAKARLLLGWEPTADWDESVKATVEWFRRPGASAAPPRPSESPVLDPKEK